jgi:DEAD/DEAH box helicase domain-containing protein
MHKEVVLDIETQNSFADVGGLLHDKLKISLVGVYFYETDEYASYLEHELPNLWPRLEHADRIIGYNTKGFDYLVMNSYYPGDLSAFPSLDILEEISKALGFRVKLDDVAAATLGYGKSGHGLQAIEFFRKGDLQKLRDYCLMDVKITKEVYEYGRERGELFFFDRAGVKKPVKVDLRLPEKPARGAINLTMPF